MPSVVLRLLTVTAAVGGLALAAYSVVAPRTEPLVVGAVGEPGAGQPYNPWSYAFALAPEPVLRTAPPACEPPNLGWGPENVTLTVEAAHPMAEVKALRDRAEAAGYAVTSYQARHESASVTLAATESAMEPVSLLPTNVKIVARGGSRSDQRQAIGQQCQRWRDLADLEAVLVRNVRERGEQARGARLGFDLIRREQNQVQSTLSSPYYRSEQGTVTITFTPAPG